MDKKEAIKYLKEQLNSVAHLSTLHYNNSEYPLWLDTLRGVVEKVFGKDSPEYQKLAARYTIAGSPEAKQKSYRKVLIQREIEILAIINIHEIIGTEEQSPKQSKQEIKAESPLSTFDAMQFHPRVVEASKSCFATDNYREAILNAFISFIDYVKEITGLDLDGDDLMNQAFAFNYDKKIRKITKYPLIRINELKKISDRDEQQGFMFMCKGAAGGIRNPKAHKLIPQSNPLHTLEYLAFASLLMRRVEEGTLVNKEHRY
ncbi:MAG: TIGR02391 family protein [Dehalococcoidales bacterium]|jgi:uncharacterized protein (TIGR02391 family)